MIPGTDFCLLHSTTTRSSAVGGVVISSLIMMETPAQRTQEATAKAAGVSRCTETTGALLSRPPEPRRRPVAAAAPDNVMGSYAGDTGAKINDSGIARIYVGQGSSQQLLHGYVVTTMAIQVNRLNIPCESRKNRIRVRIHIGYHAAKTMHASATRKKKELLAVLEG